MYSGIYSAVNKSEIVSPSRKCMELESILVNWNKPIKTDTMFSFICRFNLDFKNIGWVMKLEGILFLGDKGLMDVEVGNKSK